MVDGPSRGAPNRNFRSDSFFRRLEENRSSPLSATPQLSPSTKPIDTHHIQSTQGPLGRRRSRVGLGHHTPELKQAEVRRSGTVTGVSRATVGQGLRRAGAFMVHTWCTRRATLRSLCMSRAGGRDGGLFRDSLSGERKARASQSHVGTRKVRKTTRTGRANIAFGACQEAPAPEKTAGMVFTQILRSSRSDQLSMY